MKDDRFRRAMADIPVATPEQMTAYGRQYAIRRHFNDRSVCAGRIYNRMFRDLQFANRMGEISDEIYWAKDGALWAKVSRIMNKCAALRDARIAAIKAEVHQ